MKRTTRIYMLHLKKNASFLHDLIIVRTTFSAKNNNNPNWEGRNYKRQARVRGGAFCLWSLVREVRSVRDCERGWNGEWLNGEKRVWRRLGWGWRKSPGSPNPDAEERICGSPTEGSWRTKRRSAESNSTPGFRRLPWARGSPQGTSRSPETSTAP
jgi:hypothetical protein